MSNTIAARTLASGSCLSRADLHKNQYRDFQRRQTHDLPPEMLQSSDHRDVIVRESILRYALVVERCELKHCGWKGV